MSKVSQEQFEGKEISRVYIAASVKEATQIEEILTTEHIDFIVEIEAFLSSVLMSPSEGAAFYVVAGQAPFCRQHLMECGYRQGITKDD